MARTAESAEVEVFELPIFTKRLRLRRFEPGDVDAFCDYRSDPEVGRFQGWHPFTLDEAQQFIDQQQDANLDLPGRWFQTVIAHRTSNAILGDIGLCRIGGQEAEISFTLSRAAQGRGYGSEAVEAVIRKLTAVCGVRSLRAVSDVRNLRSIALLERVGFVLKRTSREIFHGQWCEQHRFTLDAE
jgi:RimJ/RimL family protein N-acetyltransferase